MNSIYKKESEMSDLFDVLYHEEKEELKKKRRKAKLLRQQEENLNDGN
jgi:hypothetical protein